MKREREIKNKEREEEIKNKEREREKSRIKREEKICSPKLNVVQTHN